MEQYTPQKWPFTEALELKFADEPSKYDLKGNCYFKLTNGGTLKLSAKDCLEVFNTLADIAIMPFDRDRISEQMEEKLIEEDLL